MRRLIRRLVRRASFALRLMTFYTLHRRSARAIRTWQEAKTLRRIRHAYANIPLYRDILDAAGVRPESLRTLDDLNLLPILSKKSFLGRPVQAYTNQSQPLRTMWLQTSGTSGEPFTFASTPLALNEKTGRFLRFKFMLSRGMSLREIWNMRIAQIKIRSGKQGNKLFIPVRDFLTDPEAAIAALLEFQPLVIESYVSILLDLARTLKARGLSLPSLRYVVAFGEKLTPESRSYIEDATAAEVYDRYGIEELAVVGCECAEHDGFHAHSETIILEIVDADGNPVPDGTYGRVVGTDFRNFNMPFIRYDTGDHGRMTVEHCPCGLSTPRVWIEGRYSASFTLDGKKIHHLEFDGALDGFMNVIVQYQVARTGAADLEIRVVPAPAFAESHEEEMRAKVRALVGENIRISVRRVESISRTERGKSQILVDDTA